MFNETKSASDAAQVIARAHAKVAAQNSGGFGNRPLIKVAYLFYDAATGEIPTPRFPEILVPGEDENLERVVCTPTAFEVLLTDGNFTNPTFGEVTAAKGGAPVPVIRIDLVAGCRTYDGHNQETHEDTVNFSVKNLPKKPNRRIKYGKEPESLTT